MRKFTDIFIERPVLATVVSVTLLVLGLRSIGLLPVLQFPQTQNAVVTVTTTYFGADPALVAGFITTPLEASADLEHNLADLRAAIEGEAERLIVPEGNLLDVNRAELGRAFPGHPMFTNLGALLASLKAGGE